MAAKRSPLDRLEVMIDALNREVEKIKERLDRIEKETMPTPVDFSKYEGKE